MNSGYRDRFGAQLMDGDEVYACTSVTKIKGIVEFCPEFGGWVIRVTYRYSRYLDAWVDVTGQPVTVRRILSQFTTHRLFKRRLDLVEMTCRKCSLMGAKWIQIQPCGGRVWG
jgi:hypothetical protein